MNIGLLYTPVSIYQMTRGALVLFVGSFSVIFLRRRLWLYQLSFVDPLTAYPILHTSLGTSVNRMYPIIDGFRLLP